MSVPQWVLDEIRSHPERTYMRESMRELKARHAVGQDLYSNAVEERLERLELLITALLDR